MCMALNNAAATQTATPACQRQPTKSRWTIPLKNNSSLNPARTATISRFITSDPISVPPSIASVVRAAVSSSWRKDAAIPSGSGSEALASITQFMAGILTIMVNAAKHTARHRGRLSTARKRAGRRVSSTATMTAGSTNSSISCITAAMRSIRILSAPKAPRISCKASPVTT